MTSLSQTIDLMQSSPRENAEFDVVTKLINPILSLHCSKVAFLSLAKIFEGMTSKPIKGKPYAGLTCQHNVDLHKSYLFASEVRFNRNRDRLLYYPNKKCPFIT